MTMSTMNQDSLDYLVDEGTGNPVRALSKWISDIEGKYFVV